LITGVKPTTLIRIQSDIEKIFFMDGLIVLLVALVFAYAAVILALEILDELFQFLSANAGAIFSFLIIVVGGFVLWIVMRAAKGNGDIRSSSEGSSSSNFHHQSGGGTSESAREYPTTSSAELDDFNNTF
jgi:uncharacterized membrane protein